MRHAIVHARMGFLILVALLSIRSARGSDTVTGQPGSDVERAVLAGDWDKVIMLLADKALAGDDPIAGFLVLRACDVVGCHERPPFRIIDRQAWLEWTGALLARHPDNIHALNLSADAALRAGMLDTAMARTARAISLDPANATGYHYRGRIFWRQGLTRSAISSLNIAVQKAPGCAAIYVSRGSVYQSDGQYQLALADFDKALSLDPANEAAYEGRGNVHHSMKEYAKAVEDYTDALRVNPRSSTMYLCRGLTYEDMGKKQEALADYDSSIAIEPGDYEPYMAKAQLCQDLGRLKEAATAYSTYIDHASMQRGDLVYLAMQSLAALVREGQPYRTLTAAEEQEPFTYDPGAHRTCMEYTQIQSTEQQLFDTSKFESVFGSAGRSSTTITEITSSTKAEQTPEGYTLTVTPLTLTTSGTHAGYDNPPIAMGEAFSVGYQMADNGSLRAITGVARTRNAMLESLPPATRSNPPPEFDPDQMTDHYRKTWHNQVGQYLGHIAAPGEYWVWIDTLNRPGQDPPFVVVYSASIVLPKHNSATGHSLRVRTIQSTSPDVFDGVLDRPVLEALGPGAPPFTEESQRFASYDRLSETEIDPATMRIHSEMKIEWWHVHDPLLVTVYGDDAFWTNTVINTDTRFEYPPE